MNRFVKLAILASGMIVTVVVILRYQEQIDQSLGQPNAANYLTLAVLIVESSIIFLETGQTKALMSRKKELLFSHFTLTNSSSNSNLMTRQYIWIRP